MRERGREGTALERRSCVTRTFGNRKGLLSTLANNTVINYKPHSLTCSKHDSTTVSGRVLAVLENMAGNFCLSLDAL